MRLLRFKELKNIVGLGRTTIWRLEHRGEFPRRRQISHNAVAWLEDEVEEWVKTRGQVGTAGQTVSDSPDR